MQKAVVITGFNLPNTCEECRFHLTIMGNNYCIANDSMIKHIVQDCPLKEVMLFN